MLLSLAMASATGARIAAPQARQASDITVWLMGDAQTNWPEAVAAANQAFAQKHPGVNVKVQYQTWGDYKTKFEATLGAGNGPDVIEFGNTDTPKYTAAGALAPLNKADFPNSGTWLSGLAKAGSYNGKTFAVPYYAGARGVIYRTDQYKAAGIKSTPKSLAEFQAAGQKLMAKYGGSKDPTYSAVYFPGRYWYAAMSFVYDFGGQIAKTKGGKWIGALDSPQALQGLAAWRTTALKLSRANKTVTRRILSRRSSSPRARSARSSATAGSGRTPSTRRSATPPDRQDRRLPDAESHEGPVHADVPRRLGPRRPGHEQGEGARGRLDRCLHELGNETTMAVKGGVIPNSTTLARINASKPTLARSPRLRRRVGSSRRRRTGRTSRARTSSEHAQRHSPEPRQDEGAREAGERPASRRS
jgi:hypothetical protein